MSEEPRKLTEFQARVLTTIRDTNPASPSCLGQELWPDKKHLSAQGAALAGGGAAGKLVKLGLLRVRLVRHGSDLWPSGYELTSAGIQALHEHEENGE